MQTRDTLALLHRLPMKEVTNWLCPCVKGITDHGQYFCARGHHHTDTHTSLPAPQTQATINGPLSSASCVAVSNRYIGKKNDSMVNEGWCNHSRSSRDHSNSEEGHLKLTGTNVADPEDHQWSFLHYNGASVSSALYLIRHNIWKRCKDSWNPFHFCLYDELSKLWVTTLSLSLSWECVFTW